MNTQTSPPLVMVIGGLDPTGGAGLCADIQTLSNLGCHATPVITAVTVQDTTEVKRFELVDTELIKQQMQTVFDDMSPTVIKTGMLASNEIVAAVAEILADRPKVQLIVDPVMSSNNDSSLSEHSLSTSIRKLLMPLAALICPNIPEAEILAGKEISSALEADECAALLFDEQANSDCLITGTHAATGQVINRYYQQGIKTREWSWQRLPFDYHGSGCTLASAIAAGLACGSNMEQAIEQAQSYVMNSLILGFKPGHGQHLPARFELMSGSDS